MIFIAEVKTQSPFGFRSDKSWDELFQIADDVGDWISVHVEPAWGGSLSLIEKAKKLTDKPILAKGLHRTDIDILNSLHAGADRVLVVGRISKVFGDFLIEPNSIAEITDMPPGTAVVWNARDLRTGKMKKETFQQAREAWPGWLCQASMIKSRDDISKDAEAFLVGEHLPSFSSWS